MNPLLRALSLFASARRTREAVASARNSVAQVAATAEGYHAASVQRTLIKAQEGDTTAMFDLGEHFYDGRGVPQNYQEAFLWFLAAAKQGHVRAQTNVGLMLLLGRGTAKDGVEAYTWLKRAAVAGATDGERTLESARRKLGPEEIAEGERRAIQPAPG